MKSLVFGIDLTKDFQKALVNEAVLMLEKRFINPCASFSYAIIKGDSFEQRKYFKHPMALQKLALFIIEVYKENKKERNPKPLLLCVQNSTTNSYLIVGSSNTAQMGQTANKK